MRNSAQIATRVSLLRRVLLHEITRPLSIQRPRQPDKRNPARCAVHAAHGKSPKFEPTEKQQDDLNVDAAFAKLKTNRWQEAGRRGVEISAIPRESR
jgi:hypothetical protein